MIALSSLARMKPFDMPDFMSIPLAPHSVNLSSRILIVKHSDAVTCGIVRQM